MESAEYEIKLKDSFSSGLNKLEGRMNQFEGKVGGLGSSIASVFGGVTLASAVSTGIGYIKDLATSIVSLGADMEMTRVSFATMLGGDQMRADKLIADITDLGAKTVFTSSQINKQAQLLLNYGTAVDDVIPYLTMLGDASAGNIDSFQGLTRAFGQIQATGRLMGQDLNQLINAGFNPLQEISRKTGRSMGDLKKDMEDGLISFDAVRHAFKAATSEGGRFYGLNDKLSKTLSGRWSTLQDTIERLGTKLGTKLLPVLGSIVDGFSSLAEIIPRIDFSVLSDTFSDIFTELSEFASIFNQLLNMMGASVSTFDLISFAVRGLALSLRTGLFPLRFMLELFSELVLLIKGSVPIFTGFGQILKGIFTANLTLLNKGIDTLGGATVDLFTKMKNSAGDFINREKEGYDKIFSPLGGADDKNKSGLGGATTSGSTTSVTAGGKSNAIGVEKVQAGTRNVSITINKLIEKITFEKWDGKSEAKLQEMVTRALLTSVNDVNIVSQ